MIEPRVWSAYLWIFPLLSIMTLLIGLALVATGSLADVSSPGGVQAILTITGLVVFVGVAVPGFVCVLFLRRAHVPTLGAPLADLLVSLASRGGLSGLAATKVERTSLARGLAYGIAGTGLLLGTTLMPLPLDERQASALLRATEQLDLLGFFLIVRARRYFQVSADSLLAVDRRAPVLFLRSFADDERQHYGSSRGALLDFSLETRLANHFHRFGPFIAVGSPKETIPQPGAARVLLSDDGWQGKVLSWVREARLIIMYCGTTAWVNWELRQVVLSGRATSLIVMFPEVRSWRRSRRERDVAARVGQLRDAFRNTPWNEELTEFDDFTHLRAMLFRADGSMVMIKSRSHSRDAYHLAALIAHRQLLEPVGGTHDATFAAN